MSHRLCRGLVFVACCLGMAAALPLLSRGDGPPRGDKYALLIGVRRYDPNELRDLPYAEADMTALADVLKKAGYTRVVLLTQTNGVEQGNRFLPMAENVRKSLKGMLGDLSPDDTVLVAFAGHGVQFSGEDDNYFCPMDAKLADKKTLISLSEVYKELEKSTAGTRLLLADCCRNDPRSEDARAADKIKLESVTRPQKALPPGGVAAFFSCSAGEKAFERADLGHGVFFHFIIEGLQGKADLDRDGQVDLDELVSYTKKQVRNFVKDTYGDDVRQMPELVGKMHGTVALVKLDGSSGPVTATGSKTAPSGQPDTTTDETKLKDDYTAPTVGMKMKLIRPGKFLMGSPKQEDGRFDDEGPQHEVEITKPFYMGVYTVTYGQFAAFVKDAGYATEAEKSNGEHSWRNPSPSGFLRYVPMESDPVVDVTWNDAVRFCQWLSQKEKRVYELPTEAEWEYACRAGAPKPTAYFFGDDPKQLNDYAWYDGNSAGSAHFGGGYTHTVGEKKPNPWGLYDMHGNVWQWCTDGYDKYQEGSVKDPIGKESANSRVMRGGSCDDGPRNCRSANRGSAGPTEHRYGLGFRVVSPVPATTP